MSFAGDRHARRLRIREHVAERAVRQARAPGDPAGSTACSPTCVRFQREAREAAHRATHDPSLGHFLDEHRYSRAFVDRLIVPQAAAVWSADPRQMWSFPARFLVEFFDNHGMLGLTDRPKWRTVQGGSHRYVEALTAPWREKLRLSTPVRSISRNEDHVEVTSARRARALRRGRDRDALRPGARAARRPDGPRARAARRDPLPGQRGGAAHRQALLPRRRRAWASWNYHLLDEPTGKPTVTYHMNRLQSLRAEREFCVTLNHPEAIDPDKVIRTIPYAHPVYTAEGQDAQNRHGEISGQNRTHYCGAYWGWGFHEDGVAERRCASRRPLASDAPARSTKATSSTAAARCGTTRSATGSRWPTSTSTSCPALLGGRLTSAAPASRASAAATTSATRDGRSTSGARARAPSASGAHPQGPIRLLTHLRTLGHSLQPGQLLLLLRRRRRRSSRRSSPRSRTRRGASATPT